MKPSNGPSFLPIYVQNCQHRPHLGPAHSQLNQNHPFTPPGLESAHFKLGLADVKCRQPPYSEEIRRRASETQAMLVLMSRGPNELCAGISQLSCPAIASGECRAEVPPGAGKSVSAAQRMCWSLPSLQHWETFPVANSRGSCVTATLSSPQLVRCKLRLLL